MEIKRTAWTRTPNPPQEISETRRLARQSHGAFFCNYAICFAHALMAEDKPLTCTPVIRRDFPITGFGRYTHFRRGGRLLRQSPVAFFSSYAIWFVYALSDEEEPPTCTPVARRGAPHLRDLVVIRTYG